MASWNAVDGEQPTQRQSPSGTNAHSRSNGQVPIRTVYCEVSEESLCINVLYMVDEIKSRFGQFGKLELVSLQFDGCEFWCLVQFERQEDAKEAILRTQLPWDWGSVKAADPWHQPEHPLRVAPAQNSDLNISVALNDDCLQNIFGRLTASSLTNVAGVCKRFNEHAKKAFALKHKHLNIREQFHLNYKKLIESAMKYFGKDIQSLIFDAYSNWKMDSAYGRISDGLRMIGQNCGPKLKQLELQHNRFPPNSLSLRPIFSQIEHLKLVDCASSFELGELLACCGELKSLSHCEFTCGKYTWNQTFPKLQEISLKSVLLPDEEIFEGFVTRHPTLIKLSIVRCHIVEHIPRAIRIIGQHAKNLQELRLSDSHSLYDFGSDEEIEIQNEAAYIGQLSSLQKLQLDIDILIFPVLNALVAGEVPIKSMKIQFSRHWHVDALKCISQLKRIKFLEITTVETRRMTDENVVELAKLPELEELHLRVWKSFIDEPGSDYEFKSQLSTIGLRKMLMYANKLKLLKLSGIHSIKIDVDDYKAMLSMIQKRKENAPLLIEIHGKNNQVDVPVSVLAENRSTFNIIMSKY